MKRARRDGVRATVGLVVEGDTEFAALPRLHTKKLIEGCPPLRAVNLGGVGSDRNADGIARLVAPKVIQHKLAGRQKVVVCLDREQRDRCAPGLASDIRTALAVVLEGKGHRTDDVHIVVADRSFEAWLLAGSAGFVDAGLFIAAPKRVCFEGELCEQGKKGVVELSRLLARPYEKTADGPRLFEDLDIKAARSHGSGLSGSRSFDKFLRSVGV